MSEDQPADHAARAAAGSRAAELQALSRDLTAAQAAVAELERRLAVNDGRLGAVLEQLPDGFCAVDRDLRFTYLNAAAERIWDRGRAEVLGQFVGDALPSLIDSNLYQAMLAAGEEGHAVAFEEQLAEHAAWITGRAFPLPDGIGVSFQDVTERYHAEKEWQESEARYRMLFNRIDVGFCIVDLIFDDDGKPLDYRFLEANPAFAELTGLHDPIGKTARELAPGLNDSWFQIYGNVAMTGEAIRFENDAPALDHRWFDVFAFRLGNEDSRRVAIVFTNVTERKRLARAQQDFVAMVGHDLSNPLAVLRGWAQLMQRRQTFDAAGVEAMLDQAKRMERLVADLREYVKFETGHFDLQLAHCDVAVIAAEAVTRARVQAPRRRFATDLPAAPVMTVVDSDRLGQVLDNLLSNAHKYTPETTLITLRLAPAALDVRIEIIDQGDGIPPDVLPRLFDRFYRGERAGATQAGLGLGLHISRMLVEGLGGAIAVASTAAGTVFTITLPVTGADERRIGPGHPPAAAATPTPSPVLAG